MTILRKLICFVVGHARCVWSLHSDGWYDRRCTRCLRVMDAGRCRMANTLIIPVDDELAMAKNE
jgi:hypothetical protein